MQPVERKGVGEEENNNARIERLYHRREAGAGEGNTGVQAVIKRENTEEGWRGGKAIEVARC